MAKSKETFNKKEKEKKRLKERQEKKERMEQRKANGAKSFDDMIAYVDDDGNITSTPPDPKMKKVYTLEEIQIGVPKEEKSDTPEEAHTGRVSFFNQAKGFGFIMDANTNERIFVHANQLTEPIAEGDKVSYGVENGFKGLSAIDVKKI